MTLRTSRAAVLFAFALIAAGAAGDRAEQDFVAANDLALKGDLSGAIALYETLIAQGAVHGDVYFNLGNVYALAGRDVDGIVAWERALRLAPGDADAIANLATVRKRIVRAPKAAPDADRGDIVLADVLEPLIAHLPLEPFGYAVLAANALLFLVLALRRRALETKSRRRYGFATVLVALALTISLAVVAAHAIVARDPRAVVIEAVDAKEGPNPRFAAKAAISAGERVRVLDDDGDFVKVLREDGTSGWVPAKALVRI